MPRRRPPSSHQLSIGNALLLLLVSLPLTFAAAQQQSRDNAHKHSSPQGNAALDRHRHSLKNTKESVIIPTNERALATLAPADQAVRAPPARSVAHTAGLSLPSARSLQDWQVEDIILLATVDGKIYARDRKTGAHKWQLETERPMVDTVYHRNESESESGAGAGPQEDTIWIVEPTQDGSLYIYSPGAGVQRLGMTVKQLAEVWSPWAQDDPPLVYTAEKKNTLYTVDAATGNILKLFSSTGSVANDDRSCRRVNALETGLEDDECEPIGTITLGRTEYTVAVQDRHTGAPIATINYFEWVPNNKDRDLGNQYTSTMDNKYIYVQHDGGVFAVDHRDGKGVDTRFMFKHKFPAPVVRVFDVVRPVEDVMSSNDASLVLLPQPIGPVGEDSTEGDKIFVNCTEGGSWYGMSEKMYPTVTDGASQAVCYSEPPSEARLVHPLPASKQRAKLVGIHKLSSVSSDHQRSILSIGGLESFPAIGSGPSEEPTDAQPIEPKNGSRMAIYLTVIVPIIIVLALRAQWHRAKQALPHLSRSFIVPVKDVVVPAEVKVVEQLAAPEPKPAPAEKKVRFPEPAEEIVFGQDSGTELEKGPSASAEESEGDTTKAGNGTVTDAAAAQDQNTPKKKKAHRGMRGGRKVKEKQQQQLELQRRRAESQSGQNGSPTATAAPTPAKDVDVISVEASENLSVKGKIQINKLVVDTDNVVGYGSAGTVVFAGEFEGQAVAVKRMISQYYELAESEVQFLHQTGHHRNVVKYYCQERDAHFLYIAVELCQASLWDLYFSTPDDEDRRQRITRLVRGLQRDVPKALHQLASGLEHLHSLRIIHRDIKPQNILIAFPKRNESADEPRLIISDFGLCKTLPDNMSTVRDATSSAGTTGWKAPELINQPKEASNNGSAVSQNNGSDSSSGEPGRGVKRAADIFSLGCLFFWVLTGGSHPFDDEEGWMQMRELNIKKNKLQNMDKLDLGADTEEPMQLITAMLQHNPEDRPTARQVVNHPFFWSAEKRLAFLCDVSDHFEREPRDPPSEHLDILEEYGPEVHGNDFLAKLDHKFIDTLGKQRKYTGSRMLDLLRALRNKKNHYEDMPEDVKKRVGTLPKGYLMYWTTKFPKLLMACYHVVGECRIAENDRFKGYFDL